MKMKNIKKIDIKKLEVRAQLDCGDIIIKLYNIPCNSKCNRNITGEDKYGKLLWQVEDVAPLFDSPFTSISAFDNERIEAYNWNGIFYYIDIKNGKLDVVNRNARPW